jgi:CHAT domain-containing protein
LASARLAEKDPSKRSSMRRYQDLEDELAQMDVRLLNAVLNKAPTDQLEQIKRKSEAAHSALEALGTHSREKKELGQLATDVVVPYDLMRDHIRTDEAILSFQPGAVSTFVFVATREGLHWFRANIGLYELQTGIAELRCGVDPQMPLGRSRSFCRRATNSDANGPVPFALGTSHRLYDSLLGPARQLIEGKSLIFVLSGPMSALQPNLLAENVPLHPMASKAEDFEGAGWLVEKHAISVVPAVSSFLALRSRNDRGRGGISQRFEGTYLGLGNPALAGTPACPKTRIPERCSQLIEVAANQTDRIVKRAFVVPAQTYVGGGRANVQAIRAICPLPETQVEIRCVAESLGGAKQRVIFGERLTESELKRIPLDRYRIIHFATHGLLADEVLQLGSSDAEPALVLTPPRLATGEDDGLLKASEIAQLRLDADLVILSACNTAASGSLESDALSGLARAFFYAGARSLLVSHWPVDSAATVVLITRTFNRIKGDRNIGRAEALRLAMVSVMSDPRFAHPSKWAPFALIGED